MRKEELKVGLEDVTLDGILRTPEDVKGTVLFAHGSGSSRLSPRNNFVANLLTKNGLRTFLFDLLTEKEDRDYDERFDIEKISGRLFNVTDWIKEELGCDTVGYFGSSTGAAAALMSASRRSDIGGIVSRGGRPDLVIDELVNVSAPTLLIVGGEDTKVIEMNRTALKALECEKKLELVPGAGHLFEGEGELELVAEMAGNWFLEHMGD